MDINHFESLVKKHEKSASANTGSYRFKVLLFTGLGYSYVLFFLALFLFLLVISIAMFADGHFTFGNLKVLLLTGALSFFISKALWIKDEMPDGYYLSEIEAASLRKIINEISLQLKTPPIHKIILNYEYNAGVKQYSKYGFAGPKQNILLIGVPLLSTLNPEQLKAVLAHELAHISHSDTAFGAKIYRIRKTWERLLISLEENEQFGTFIFRKFFKWYYPRYNAYTFALARQQEYDADAASARVTSPEAVRDTLCTIPIGAAYYYDDFYNELFHDCSKDNKVPTPYSDFISKFKSVDKSQRETYLNKELKLKSYFSDTHPCLADRLASINAQPSLPAISEKNALEVLIRNYRDILHDFDQSWIQENENDWKNDLKEFNQSKVRFDELSALTTYSLDELYEKAKLAEEFKGKSEAEAIYKKIIDSFAAIEQIAPAYLNLAAIKFESDDKAEEAISLTNKAIELDWEARLPGLNMLCDYYFHNDLRKEFEAVRDELEKWEDLVDQSDEECNYFHPADLFVSADVSEKMLTQGIEQIRKNTIITEAFLVRKVLAAIPERELFLLGLKVIMPKGKDVEEFEEKLYEKYTEELSAFENTAILILNGKGKLEESIKSVEGSRIYSRLKKDQAS
ncbi:M48 family metallopeptidase [Neobacillus terrae]|uniref:M48 family metallopeptidase n=1 Tax=Neobacillus terrae TaxID=3034837 RepID=UPI00140AAEC7|nr:M48 family metallopeptidase [Neobacillus terrae]NHM32705.1 M48 family metalloprotease [Neobacillus terrae]